MQDFAEGGSGQAGVTKWQLGEEGALRVLRGVLPEPGRASFTGFTDFLGLW